MVKMHVVHIDCLRPWPRPRPWKSSWRSEHRTYYNTVVTIMRPRRIIHI